MRTERGTTPRVSSTAPSSVDGMRKSSTCSVKYRLKRLNASIWRVTVCRRVSTRSSVAPSSTPVRSAPSTSTTTAVLGAVRARRGAREAEIIDGVRPVPDQHDAFGRGAVERDAAADGAEPTARFPPDHRLGPAEAGRRHRHAHGMHEGERRACGDDVVASLLDKAAQLVSPLPGQATERLELVDHGWVERMGELHDLHPTAGHEQLDGDGVVRGGDERCELAGAQHDVQGEWIGPGSAVRHQDRIDGAGGARQGHRRRGRVDEVGDRRSVGGRHVPPRASKEPDTRSRLTGSTPT